MRADEPDAIFFEQHTGFMLWRGAWWVNLDGCWFALRNESMTAALHARWVQIHATRVKARQAQPGPPPPSSAPRIVKADIIGDVL